MKKLSVLILILILLLTSGCNIQNDQYQIVATTLPVYDFTSSICKGTPLRVGRLISEHVSCLHDYTLQVKQMKMVENAEIVIISGIGLEDFLGDVLSSSHVTIDCSESVQLHHAEHSHDDHESSHDHHENDPHIWLSPENASIMAKNICNGLESSYPQYADVFQKNLNALLIQLEDLQEYGTQQLSELSCRELITFHDGFSYFVESYDLKIIKAIEEESGSEASAAEIIELIRLVNTYDLPAIFTEINGSNACAGIISAETGVKIYTLDMAMSGSSYFDSMYHNIDTIKEALS